MTARAQRAKRRRWRWPKHHAWESSLRTRVKSRKLLSRVCDEYIEDIAITVFRHARRLVTAACRRPAWARGFPTSLRPKRVRTWVVCLLLGAVSFAPTLARAQQRFSISRSPAQEYSRFRWSNSCGSVPAKATFSRAVAIVRKGEDLPVSRSLPPWHVRDSGASFPSAVLATPSGLRAPPNHAA
jgi:hypothetical protein